MYPSFDYAIYYAAIINTTEKRDIFIDTSIEYTIL